MSESIRLTGVPVNTPMLRPTLLSGRWLRDDDTDALVVSRRLLHDQPELQTGQAIELLTDGHSSRWTVVGVIDAGPQMLAYVPRATLDRRAGNTDASSLVVALAPASKAIQLDAVLRLRAEFTRAGMPVASSQLLAENHRVLDDHLLMVVDFLGAMGWLMLAVGGMGAHPRR